MVARHRRVARRGALGDDLHVVAPEEDLDRGHVDERQRHQLVADRLGGLLERRLGRRCCAGSRPAARADARLEGQLRLGLAQLGDVARTLT